jgi:hypothetical protein
MLGVKSDIDPSYRFDGGSSRWLLIWNPSLVLGESAGCGAGARGAQVLAPGSVQRVSFMPSWLATKPRRS